MKPNAGTQAQAPRGNGRTPAENRLYASIAAQSRPRETQLRSIELMRAARRRNIADRIDPGRVMDPSELERAIDREISLQLARARAARLTKQRQAREAAEAELDALEAAGYGDAS